MTSVDFSLDQVVAERYRLHGVLGRGGMSDVYRADDLLGGGQVALKIVRSDDPSFARRLVQETGALERLEHPGLVRLLDAGTIGDRMYLAMELVEGPTLVEVLREGPMTPTRAARLGRTVAGALAYVHRAGVVHRDVKPGNVMLDADGTARLGDFGIALLSDTSTLTAEGTTLGTAAYMAPEQLEDHHVGPEADVWSLGIVLLECLTGRRAYEGGPAEVVARRLAGPVPLPSSLPTPWRILLVGMLDHRPDQRLKDEEVEALLSGTAFDPPWMPDAEAWTGSTKPTEPLPADLTALDEIKVAPAAMFPVPPDALGRRRRHRKRILAEMTAGVLALALVLTLLLVITGSRSPHASAKSSSSHAASKKSGAASTSTTTTSTTTTSTTTTAPPPPGSAALSTLDDDVQSALSAGTIDQTTGSTVTEEAAQAVSDAAAGQVPQVTNDLGQAGSALALGVGDGAVAPAAYSQITGDLGALGSALGVTGPTTAAAPAAPAASPAPAHGGGPRRDHGDGSGDQNS
ncbi:MAG: serine/threonine-protein kinase [Acidimicrobiales bacterium]